MTDAVDAFVQLMQGNLDPDRIADGARSIEAAQVQSPAVGRITIEAFYIEVKLELTSGDLRAFQGKGGIFSVGGNLELGGSVYTTDSSRLFGQTTGFTMTSDGAHLYFLDSNLGLLGHFSGTATGKPLGKSPAIGTGGWFVIPASAPG